MRISDWSSDVCSSDLGGFLCPVAAAPSETLPSKFNLGNVILMVRTKKLRKTDYHDLAALERSPLLADLRCNRDPRNCLDAHRQERQQIRLSRRRDDRPGRQENEDHDHDAIRKEQIGRAHV